MKPLLKGTEINKEITITAPIDLVWYAWTISERVSEWFASEAIINPKIDGAYELYFIPGNKTGMNTKGCKITKIVEQNELHFTWKGPDQFASIMNDENSLTLVKVNFSNTDNNITKISVNHSGFKSDENWSEVIKWHDMAWSGVLSSLKSALEKGEGNLCCKP
ncbi:SRPBCC domain-containing protein [Psychrobacillus sp. FSL K6-2843]|uniref:SRPBCC family protein n=1 Tax=Psychrobacillus sp. FSL K6-2843 TaxID=2921549 RepID=UPI00315A5372